MNDNCTCSNITHYKQHCSRVFYTEKWKVRMSVGPSEQGEVTRCVNYTLVMLVTTVLTTDRSIS